MRSVPVMLLIPIQGRDPRHLRVSQFKAEQVQVLPDMVRVAGAGDDHYAPLEIPPQDHLGGGDTVILRDGGDHRIAQQLRRMASAAEGVPALDHDAQTLDIGRHVLLLVVGVDLILHQGGGDIYLGQKLLQFLDIPVGQAQRADLSVGHRRLHGVVRLHVTSPRVVKEHHVNVADVQLRHRLVDGGPGGSELARVELGDDENLLTVHVAVPDGPAHGRLVVVHIGGVDEPSAALQQGGDGVVALLVAEGVGAQAHDGHLVAAVDRDDARLEVEHRRGAISRRRQAQVVDPHFHFLLGGVPRKAGPLQPVGAGSQRAQVVVAGADAAGVGGAEGHDGLAGKVVGLQEGADDPGRLAVPDGVTQEHRVVLFHVRHRAGDGGAGVRVILLLVGPAAGVVVQIGVSVGLRRDDLIEVSVQDHRRVLRQGPGGAGGGEIGHQGVAALLGPGSPALLITGQQHGGLGPGKTGLGMEGIVCPAGEQARSQRPPGGGGGPVRDIVPVGEVSGRCGGRAGLPPQDRHRLFSGYRVIRAEGVVPVATHDALQPGPVDPVGVPAVPWHVRKGVAQVLLLQRGASRRPIEGSDQHGPGQHIVRGKGGAAGAGKNAVLIAVLHLDSVPSIRRHVGEGRFLG